MSRLIERVIAHYEYDKRNIVEKEAYKVDTLLHSSLSLPFSIILLGEFDSTTDLSQDIQLWRDINKTNIWKVTRKKCCGDTRVRAQSEHIEW